MRHTYFSIFCVSLEDSFFLHFTDLVRPPDRCLVSLSLGLSLLGLLLSLSASLSRSKSRHFSIAFTTTNFTGWHWRHWRNVGKIFTQILLSNNNAEINVRFVAFHHLLQCKSAKRHIRIIIWISHDGTPQHQTILFSHFCSEKNRKLLKIRYTKTIALIQIL